MSFWYDTHIVLVQLTLTNIFLALSIQVPIRTGVFSFAGAGFYAIGAYAAAIGVTQYALSVPLALLAGVVVSVVAGLLLGLMLQRLSGLYLGMATVAFDLIITVVIVNGGTFTGGAQGLYGAIVDLTVPAVVVIALAAIVLLALTERGSLGRTIEVVRTDPELAASLGIRVGGYRLASFAVSGVLGSVGGGIGVLFRTTVAPTDIGFPLIVLALTMIIVGGAGSWLGALIGAVIFTWLPDLLTFANEWRTTAYGAIVALAAVWLPGGVVGIGVAASRRFGAGRRARADRGSDPGSDVRDSPPENGPPHRDTDEDATRAMGLS